MKLEDREQCQYYASLSGIVEGSLVQAQRLEPMFLEIEGKETDGKTEENRS